MGQGFAHLADGLTTGGAPRPPIFTMLGDMLEKEVDVRRIIFGLATGKCRSCPFRAEFLGDVRSKLISLATEASGRSDLGVVPEDQPFYLPLIGTLLQLSGDPDWEAYTSSSDSFAEGVALHVDTDLPHIPDVFPDKSKWRVYDEQDHKHPEFRHNYPLVQQNVDAIKEEEQLGAMSCIPLEEAKKLYGDKLVVASLGAVSRPDGSFRVLRDGTHSTGVNARIKVRSSPITPTTAAHAQCYVRPYGRYFTCPPTGAGAPPGLGISSLCHAFGKRGSLVKPCGNFRDFQCCLSLGSPSLRVHLLHVGRYACLAEGFRGRHGMGR